MSTINLFFATESEVLDFAARLAKCINEGAIIFLSGPLGAGKTTFTRGFLRGLGYNEKVKSPTYTLVECYELGTQTLFHFDLYRISDERELSQIGIEEYFLPNTICLIEWPDKGGTLLPTPDLSCQLSFAAEGRQLHMQANTVRGETILANLS